MHAHGEINYQMIAIKLMSDAPGEIIYEMVVTKLMSPCSRRNHLYCVPMKPISCILFLSGLFFLVSCSKPEAPEYLGFRDFSVENLSMDSALLHTQLAFYNPNTFVMELKRGEVNVFLDNKLANHYI